MEMALGDDGVQHAVVHYLAGGVLACMPREKVLSSFPGRPHPLLRTDDRRAVTCFLCKQTAAYGGRPGGK